MGGHREHFTGSMKQTDEAAYPCFGVSSAAACGRSFAYREPYFHYGWYCGVWAFCIRETKRKPRDEPILLPGGFKTFGSLAPARHRRFWWAKRTVWRMSCLPQCFGFGAKGPGLSAPIFCKAARLVWGRRPVDRDRFFRSPSPPPPPGPGAGGLCCLLQHGGAPMCIGVCASV